MAGEDRGTFDNVPADFVKIAQFSSPGVCSIDRQCNVPIDFFVKQLNHLLAAHIGACKLRMRFVRRALNAMSTCRISTAMRSIVMAAHAGAPDAIF